MTTSKTFNHRQIFSLAMPMIIANISTPLLGLVDTAVMGHLDNAGFLGGVALGSLIFNFVFWGFGFLRMGTTGITAQAYGNNDSSEIKAIVARALLIAMCISLFIITLQHPLRVISLQLLDSSAHVEQLAAIYFDIRIWATPATLSHYVLLGWFLGIQDVKSPLIIVLSSNLSNILLDIVLVFGLQMQIAGVALASVLAEYFSLHSAHKIATNTYFIETNRSPLPTP